MSSPRFHRLAVNDLRRESSDAVSLTFAIPKELADDYSFVPGQYLTLRTTMDGEELRRSYSICSALDDGALRVGIRLLPGGAFSGWAASHLREGQSLQVMPPYLASQNVAYKVTGMRSGCLSATQSRMRCQRVS